MLASTTQKLIFRPKPSFPGMNTGVLHFDLTKTTEM